MLTTAAAWCILVYGILVVLGGLMGYWKARSKPSLIMGGICLAKFYYIVAGLRQELGWRLES